MEKPHEWSFSNYLMDFLGKLFLRCTSSFSQSVPLFESEFYDETLLLGIF
jgi:hypothetical protein